MAVEYRYGLKEADDMSALIKNKRELYANVERRDPMAKQLFYLKREIDILEAALQRLIQTANALDNEVANAIAKDMIDAHRVRVNRYIGGFMYLYMYESLDEVIRRTTKSIPQMQFSVPVAFASNLSWQEVSIDIKFIHYDATGCLSLYDTLPLPIKDILPDND